MNWAVQSSSRSAPPATTPLPVPGMGHSARAFADRGDVVFAEPSEMSFNSALTYIPHDTDFPRLWSPHNTAQVVNGVVGRADAGIEATEAWDITRGDRNVIVAVIDTGAELDHPDLAANFRPWGTEDWDCAAAGDPVSDDVDGHGTHVCGTIAAADNTVGVMGVAPGCPLIPLRIDLQTGMNQIRADAINFVAGHSVANPARSYVINCSWRMNGDHVGVRTAAPNVVAHDVIVVFVPGNANTNMDITPQFRGVYPRVYPEVIVVAALDQSDRRTSFSNFGGNVDVLARGVNSWSTMPNDTFGFLDGTSMAPRTWPGLLPSSGRGTVFSTTFGCAMCFRAPATTSMPVTPDWSGCSAAAASSPCVPSATPPAAWPTSATTGLARGWRNMRGSGRI